MAENDDLISLAAAARALHVAPATLSRWALRGRVPYATTPGGHKKFPRDVVEAMAARQNAPLQVRAS